MTANGYRLLAVHTPWSPVLGAGKQPLTEVVDGAKQPWTLGHSQARLDRVTPFSANTGILLGGPMAICALDIDAAKTATPSAQNAFSAAVIAVIGADPSGYVLN
jgi:hypothetical protein